MARQDVEFFQSFCRRWVNRAVTEHFRDVSGNDDNSLSPSVPRQAIKRMCLHKDTDTMTLTIGRLLMWWVEARGLLEEFIYGIPSTDFEITHTYYPQVKLHFREDRYEASSNTRRPGRSEVSFRWREADYTTTNINALATKIENDFARPPFSYGKGRTCWTYWDDEKGYRFTVYVQTEADAKNLISQVIGLQDTEAPDWDNRLREHKDNVNYNLPGTIRVMGETKQKPKRRPIATVKFSYAELFIPGLTQPIVLVDRTGTKPGAIKIA